MWHIGVLVPIRCSGEEDMENLAKVHWKEHILPIMPPQLKDLLAGLSGAAEAKLEEIRLRAGRPLLVRTGSGETQVGRDMVTAADLQSVLLLITEYSLYARDEELKRGYLALPGGHRAGFVGRTVLEGGEVKLLRDISGINIRIARQVLGAGKQLLPSLYCQKTRRVRHTLIISAPQAGKTTVLRDLARLFGNGDAASGRPAFNVGIVDERSEIAGCYQGVPQLDVGLRSDVLDGCPKAEGMMMLVRSMSPQIVVTDELGRPEDARAVEEAVNTGASILATAHGQSMTELFRRPSLAYLLEQKMFERIVVLSRRKGPGTIEGVYDGEAFDTDKQAGGKINVG
ncbi:stage III sporulation protein AA [Dethiobacter alkaliphilus AHT 1]|uniref:Stage III sporulation protein AA n=2 Tax=Dethiobacter TaxID=427925 RepID=C0GE43_DETAL|nr:stage III sporulation protein AA [Dethiobacter alkaliphilus AHT 1]